MVLHIRDNLSREFPFYCNFASSRPDHMGEVCNEREIEKEHPGQNVARLFHNVGPTGPRELSKNNLNV